MAAAAGSLAAEAARRKRIFSGSMSRPKKNLIPMYPCRHRGALAEVQSFRSEIFLASTPNFLDAHDDENRVWKVRTLKFFSA